MSYLDETDTNINEDILKRKEFYRFNLESRLKQDEKYDIDNHNSLEKQIFEKNNLIFSSYQMFINNYINPNTPYKRLLVKHETGTGKTIGSISIAMNFINYYKKEQMLGNENVGSVFILGFTATQFKNELIRFPEFGFISKEELEKLNLLRRNIFLGNRYDKTALVEFKSKIKKRLTNRKGNGFFKFIGYKKITNELFILRDKGIKLASMTEIEIKDAIENNKIIINEDFLHQFKNSLIICDEIHNTYNSLEKNNWGYSINYIINHHPSTRAVFLSATPINNNPSEIIDILNMLLPKDKYPIELKKNDFFKKDGTLKQNTLSEISKLCQGRISYLRDINPKYFPTKKFIGEVIKDAPYLKFIRCPMSEFHYKTYKSIFKGSLDIESQYILDFAMPNPENDKIGIAKTNDIKKLIPFASQSWKVKNKINFAKERITGGIFQIDNIKKHSNKYYQMYQTVLNIIKNKLGKIFIYHNVIHMSGVLFLEELFLNNFIISEYGSSTENTLCSICGKSRKEHSEVHLGGNIKDEVPKFKKFITKYNLNYDTYEVLDKEYNAPIIEYKLYDNIIVTSSNNMNCNNNNIYEVIKFLSKSNYVIIKTYAINLKIQHILNNYKYKVLSTYDNCVYYGNEYIYKLPKSDQSNILRKIRNKKTKIKGGSEHTFMPVRFISAHSGLEKANMLNSIDKYNSPDNAEGYRIMILIGSRVIKEAFDIKSVREVMIMSRPDNIPTLIQIIGRAVRKNSHKLLPEENRNVNIRIFTSCLPEKDQGRYKLSFEETKYVEKLKQYVIIQNIEKTLHENAIDSVVNRHIIWPDDISKKSELGTLYYEPSIKKKFNISEINMSTFNAYHSDWEINNLVVIIKRLFIEISTVWKYNDLFNAIKKSQHNLSHINFNTELVTEGLFIIALSRLIYQDNSMYVEPMINHINNISSTMLDVLFDYNDRIIVLSNGQKCIISQIGEYYILLNLDESDNSPIKTVEMHNRISVTDSEKEIDIVQLLKNNDLFTYEDHKKTFYNKWNGVVINDLADSICDFGTEFHILFIEESIEYIFKAWTENVKKHPMHEFYFKMINYYDIHKLIIWADALKPSMIKDYNKYFIKSKISNVKTDKNVENNKESSGLVNLLKSSIEKSNTEWISSGMVNNHNAILKESLKLFDGKYKKKNTKLPDAKFLPVGHIVNNIPKFYHPITKWTEHPEYLDTPKFKENNIIIGYDDRSSTGLHTRFKIRNPIQNIKQYKDARLIEKGGVCSSKNKVYLRSLAEKIGAKIREKINTPEICDIIRTRLMYLELKEREIGSDIKWFYFIHEKRPEI